MDIKDKADNLKKLDWSEIENVQVKDLELPNSFNGIVVKKNLKNRFIAYNQVKILLDIEGLPTCMLTDTLAMRVKNLEEGKQYNFRIYDIYYTKESETPANKGICFNRGEEFSEVGSTGKIRYYRARK